jgi:hypothetical protein
MATTIEGLPDVRSPTRLDVDGSDAGAAKIHKAFHPYARMA